MEEAYFNKIRREFCLQDQQIEAGKMMSSEAITYKGKVFAFFSRSKKMVFKLGKNFNPELEAFEINVFSPFKNGRPLNGWFEVPFSESNQWELLTDKALVVLRNEL